jgi:glutamyl-tRNA synthetase
MKNGAADRLARARETIAEAEPFDAETLEDRLKPLVDELGVKARDLYQPIRVAISGSTISPGIFESVAVLGRDETLARIDRALARAR